MMLMVALAFSTLSTSPSSNSNDCCLCQRSLDAGSFLFVSNCKKKAMSIKLRGLMNLTMVWCRDSNNKWSASLTICVFWIHFQKVLFGTILEFNICSAGCFKLVRCHLFLFSRRTRAAWAAISGKVFLLTWNLDSTSPLSFYLSLCFLLWCLIVFPDHPSSGIDKSSQLSTNSQPARSCVFLVCPSWVFSLRFPIPSFIL